MADSSDDDMPLAARLPTAKKKELPSKAVKVEKADEEVAGTSASEQPATANTKANKKVQENGAHTSSAKERKAAKEVKGKAAKGEAAAEGVKEDVKVKKERKVYDMPGQTRDTPEEGDPLRRFYTSLREQRPDSAMAKKWYNPHKFFDETLMRIKPSQRLLQTGLLPLEEAEEEVAKAKKNKSPVKAARKSGSSAVATSGRSGASSGGTSRKANGASKAAAKKKPAANGGTKSGAKRKRKGGDWSEHEDEESSDEEFDSDDDMPLAQRGKAKAAAAAKKAAPAKRPSKKSKDVAFADGGLGADSDSDDDIPIGQRLVGKD